MIKLNTSRILVPFDFSLTSKKALKHAASLAQVTNGELQLLYVRKPKSVMNIGYSKAELRQLAEESQDYKKMMQSTANDIRKEYNIPVKVLVGIGRRISGILKTCEKNEVGLIVMGTEGSESVSNLFSGSNSHKVVSRSEIPVITVRSESHKEGYTHILVPVDLSDHTRQKMIVAIQFAKAFNSKIHLLAIFGKTDKSNESKLKVILRQIENRLKEEEIAYTSELLKTEKAAARTLSIAKRRKADMIITMTDQGPGPSLFNSRSYDHELVEESSIPVLSVPPEIHEENIQPASIGGLW
jgi:nucleotide-binding universal stress UspA family protein